MPKFEKLKKIILEAVPDIEARNTSMSLDRSEGPFKGLINYRDDTIRLADVLMPLNESIEFPDELDLSCMVSSENIYLMQIAIKNNNGQIACFWNLQNNNLISQSEKVWDFLLKKLDK